MERQANPCFTLQRVALAVCVWLSAQALRAGEEEVRHAIRDLAGPAGAKKTALQEIGRSRDPRLIAFLDDYLKDNVHRWKERVVLVLAAPEKEGGPEKPVPLLDPLTRAALRENNAEVTAAPSELEEVGPSGRERGWIREVQALLSLGDPDLDRRLQAVYRCGESGPEHYPFLAENSPPILTEMLSGETDARIRAALQESLLLLQLNHPADASACLRAARQLGEQRSGRALSKLKSLALAEKDPEAAAVYQAASARIERWESVARGVGYVFSGISLGSILVLMALGLSIVFGLMGVINMAHGELMTMGAYATFLTQKGFELWLPPGAFEFYFLAAIPLAFLAAALVGYLLERLVVRHLYGRPLDTLLATWGISWILIQAIRLQFGDNIAVNSPRWLQGGMEVMHGIVLPYNRIFILGFCALCMLGMYLLVQRTHLGLLLRATTQNRGMASSLGVPTRRIDGYTFAWGAGLAGLAGCMLTQIGGVTPDMGQNYIVDSFLVVVTGGVGKLAGTMGAGLGLGMLNKFFEPVLGAVWGKVSILLCVVVFLQWRPAGLFPAKGRLADA